MQFKTHLIAEVIDLFRLTSVDLLFEKFSKNKGLKNKPRKRTLVQLFKCRDPGHLAQRLGDIFSAPERAAEIAQAGLRRVTVRNDWSRLGEQSLACYRRALQEGA